MTLKLFNEEMARGCETVRALLQSQMAYCLASDKSSEDKEWICNDISRLMTQCEWLRTGQHMGTLGTLLIYAMGQALVSMKMSDWESFYFGYVEWAKSLPKCGYKGREEENARGAMLMAMKALYDERDTVANAANKKLAA